MMRLRQRMTDELELRNFSKDTIRNYIGCGERFPKNYRPSPQQMSAAQVHCYFLRLLQESELSWSAIHVYRAALRFLYVRVSKQA